MIPSDNSGVYYNNIFTNCAVIESIPFLPYINEPGWFFMVRSWLSHGETASPAVLALAQLPTSRRLAVLCYLNSKWQLKEKFQFNY